MKQSSFFKHIFEFLHLLVATFFMLLVVVSSIKTADAQTNNVWSSVGGPRYNTASNWSLGHIPGAGEVAYFDGTRVVTLHLVLI